MTFLDFFPKVKLILDLLLDTSPILILPYWMDSAELKEFKFQLKDLLDKVIINPCNSPLGDPIVIVKKKDG